MGGIVLNIQIFGKTKCFDTKKAERYFQERGIKYQLIDILQKGMSKGELNSVKQALGGYENLIDQNFKDKQLLGLVKYLREEDAGEKIFENPKLIKTPVVRDGNKATVGYKIDVWKSWK